MTLVEWQKAVLPRLRMETFAKSLISNVTLLAYFFWDDDRIETQFYRIECSVLCAYRALGILPSVLVVNRTTFHMIDFAKKYGIELQVENLSGGLTGMSRDCNWMLHARFKTPYVLIIQSDGIVVNPGLEKFLGEYDYFGAPWVPHATWRRHLPYAKYLVGNGGLTLRSKRICKSASELYHRWFARFPYSWFVSDDVFYCRTLRMLFPSYRRTFKFPEPKLAGEFSIECNLDCAPEKPPLGFHCEGGFQNYVARYGVPYADLLPDWVVSSAKEVVVGE